MGLLNVFKVKLCEESEALRGLFFIGISWVNSISRSEKYPAVLISFENVSIMLPVGFFLLLMTHRSRPAPFKVHSIDKTIAA